MMAGLPKFKRTARQMEHVWSERQTAKLIRALWLATPRRERRTAAFLLLVTRLGWVNQDGIARAWRNRLLAEYFAAGTNEEGGVAIAMRHALGSQFPAQKLLSAETGITRFYGGFRGVVPGFIRRHRAAIARCFERAAAPATNSPSLKVSAVFGILDALPLMKNAAAEMPVHAAVTPALACLEPQGRLPIMNAPTRGLLRRFRKRADAEGANELIARLRGLNFKDAFELDVYAFTQFARLPESRPVTKASSRTTSPSSTGPKSEASVVVKLQARLATITKRHNELTNRFTKLLPQYEVFNSGARYDLLIDPWRRKRALLIEAKVDSTGPVGRMQVRTAIGQLLDYRRQHFATERDRIVLALLLPKKPDAWVFDLMKEIGAAVLWIENESVSGTIEV